MSCVRCEEQLKATVVDVEQLIAEQLSLETGKVSDAVRKYRTDFCEVCPKRSGHTCTSCGCYYKFRASLPSKHCPIGKW